DKSLGMGGLERPPIPNKNDYHYYYLFIFLYFLILYSIGFEASCPPVSNQVLIELGIKEKSDAIQTRFPGVEEFSEQSEQNNSKGTNITEVFQKIGTGLTLLILGEPGSGKTITLLKLAQSLIERTEKDLSQPIPVVLNLSSWTIKQQAINEWLIEQLFDRYEVDKSFGETWIREQQLILFLDGLDEVKAEFRNDCVRELNKFTKSHGITEIVVCCRIQDYEALEEQLTLQSAICIQVLNQSQIYQYLDRAGEQLVALKTLLQKDAELRAFATSPLILSVMSLAYQGCSSEELSFLVSAGEWKQRLFDRYIERMFQRHSQTQLYSQKQTQRYLIWLAQRMAEESQTVFLIDQMQPNLLKDKHEKRIYKVVSFLISIFTTRFDLEIKPIGKFTNNNFPMTLEDFSLSQQLHSLELCSFSKLCYEAHISPKNRRWVHFCPSDAARAFCENGVGIGAILKKMWLSGNLKSPVLIGFKLVGTS
ncbi:MAG: NACHT domain-containing protein, partial [Cyanobacteria bacterium P01_A01_bin.80]